MEQRICTVMFYWIKKKNTNFQLLLILIYLELSSIYPLVNEHTLYWPSSPWIPTGKPGSLFIYVFYFSGLLQTFSGWMSCSLLIIILWYHTCPLTSQINPTECELLGQGPKSIIDLLDNYLWSPHLGQNDRCWSFCQEYTTHCGLLVPGT